MSPTFFYRALLLSQEITSDIIIFGRARLRNGDILSSLFAMRNTGDTRLNCFAQVIFRSNSTNIGLMLPARLKCKLTSPSSCYYKSIKCRTVRRRPRNSSIASSLVAFITSLHIIITISISSSRWLNLPMTWLKRILDYGRMSPGGHVWRSWTYAVSKESLEISFGAINGIMSYRNMLHYSRYHIPRYRNYHLRWQSIVSIYDARSPAC